MNPAAPRRCSVVVVLALSMALEPDANQSPAGRQSPPAASAGAIAITNVTVIDVLRGAKQTAVTVVSKEGEIAAVGRGVPVPREAVRVDGAGKFLIPAVGKRADLVLLEADPVADIVNTRRIAAVVVGGRLLSKTEIDRRIEKRRRPSR